ncbi:unnamed protein product [Schistocephalus solidus]|uniref:C2H2-type domain-containing protein n=1 Tax=Schistocephalus solidus TaxID=70667 RepID=A0A183TTU4_SCHSO|nr:unnamed protein product [Schistocephalus solidus]
MLCATAHSTHRTNTGEPLPGATTHSGDRRIHCSHCPRAFAHRMELFGPMSIHDSGKHSNADKTDIPCTPSNSNILIATTNPTTTNDNAPAPSDFSCPYCARKFNSRKGLVGHLRIHRIKTSVPVPRAPLNTITWKKTSTWLNG